MSGSGGGLELLAMRTPAATLSATATAAADHQRLTFRERRRARRTFGMGASWAWKIPGVAFRDRRIAVRAAWPFGGGSDSAADWDAGQGKALVGAFTD